MRRAPQLHQLWRRTPQLANRTRAATLAANRTRATWTPVKKLESFFGRPLSFLCHDAASAGAAPPRQQLSPRPPSETPSTTSWDDRVLPLRAAPVEAELSWSRALTDSLQKSQSLSGKVLTCDVRTRFVCLFLTGDAYGLRFVDPSLAGYFGDALPIFQTVSVASLRKGLGVADLRVA